MFVTGPLEMSKKYCYVTLRRSVGPQIVTPPRRHLDIF